MTKKELEEIHEILTDMVEGLYMDEVDIPAEPYWYCDGHKCNIDLGGVFTGKFCLLDLDTFESRIIE